MLRILSCLALVGLLGCTNDVSPIDSGAEAGALFSIDGGAIEAGALGVAHVIDGGSVNVVDLGSVSDSAIIVGADAIGNVSGIDAGTLAAVDSSMIDTRVVNPSRSDAGFNCVQFVIDNDYGACPVSDPLRSSCDDLDRDPTRRDAGVAKAAKCKDLVDYLLAHPDCDLACLTAHSDAFTAQYLYYVLSPVCGGQLWGPANAKWPCCANPSISKSNALCVDYHGPVWSN